MSACNAAEALQDHFSDFPWFVGVGIGQHDGGDAIFLYVASKSHREIDAIGGEWAGFPVLVVTTGKVEPAQQPHQLA